MINTLKTIGRSMAIMIYPIFLFISRMRKKNQMSLTMIIKMTNTIDRFIDFQSNGNGESILVV